MQTVYKRAGLVAGFVALMVVLMGNAWLTSRQLEDQIHDHELLVRTQRILLELAQTELLLDDAETGQRGYLYTGDAAYLAPYNRAVSEIDGHLRTLDGIIQNRSRRALLSQLRDDAHAKLGELQDTIALYRTGKSNQSRSKVLSGEGKSLMDDIRRLTGELEQQELQVESARTLAYSRSVWMTRASLYLATVLAVGGLTLLAFYILRQIALRESHASELREREEWYRVTLRSIGDAVIATDSNGLVTFINPIAERLTGSDFAAVHGRLITEVFPIYNEYTHEPAANPVEKVMAHGMVIGLANHTVLKARDGTLTPIEDSAAPIRDDRENLIGVVLVFRDASREREAQEIIRRAEKLAAASRLAATVSHEINNPLDAVGNLVFLAKSTPGVPQVTMDYLTLAEEQLERVSHITRQTLAFYRESKKWELVDLIALVDSALNLYSNKLNAKSITVMKEYGECPLFQGSPGELKQVVSNLISNAADAVDVYGKMKVAIASLSHGGREGVQLRIEDDGSGIAEENLDKIFEPFFTTKEEVGTGLGLWVAREIVERHGGTIRVESGRNGALPGAAFTVYLPTTDDAGARI